ncbi:hypothetical protein VTP01DRAFT_3945 [Rhizomucor pusillus]|uniref:uncharacterized protein n=1 Tax=Rhizomucor pusillus TaxID=4840 RepID=UPI003741F9A8
MKSTTILQSAEHWFLIVGKISPITAYASYACLVIIPSCIYDVYHELYGHQQGPGFFKVVVSELCGHQQGPGFFKVVVISKVQASSRWWSSARSRLLQGGGVCPPKSRNTWQVCIGWSNNSIKLHGHCLIRRVKCHCCRTVAAIDGGNLVGGKVKGRCRLTCKCGSYFRPSRYYDDARCSQRCCRSASVAQARAICSALSGLNCFRKAPAGSSKVAGGS